MDFDAFVSDIREHHWNVYGAEVYWHGCLIHAFGDTRGAHEIYSVTKSVLSVAMGIAKDRGLIGFERPVTEYIPPEYLVGVSARRKEAWEKITLHRLMTMSVTGLPFRPEGDDWLEFSLGVPIPRPEERAFHYSNISAYLAGVALTQAVGKDAGRFIEEEIFAPLGIEDHALGRSPEGYFYGASGMRMSVRSLSRIGLMLCEGGRVRGKRIVSEEYIRYAASALQTNREGGYGYFFWKYRDGFSMHGKLKQRCYVLPKRELVITFLSDLDDPSPALTESMEKHLMDG